MTTLIIEHDIKKELKSVKNSNFTVTSVSRPLIIVQCSAVSRSQATVSNYYYF